MREQIKQYLKENGIMQIFIAEKVGISKQRLNMYLQGRRGLPDEVILQLNEIINE